jgi:hypothetical protein
MERQATEGQICMVVGKRAEPQAMWVNFRGDLSSVGMHGHLGKYSRQIQSKEIEAKAVIGCTQ